MVLCRTDWMCFGAWRSAPPRRATSARPRALCSARYERNSAMPDACKPRGCNVDGGEVENRARRKARKRACAVTQRLPMSKTIPQVCKFAMTSRVAFILVTDSSVKSAIATYTITQVPGDHCRTVSSTQRPTHLAVQVPGCRRDRPCLPIGAMSTWQKVSPLLPRAWRQRAPRAVVADDQRIAVRQSVPRQKLRLISGAAAATFAAAIGACGSDGRGIWRASSCTSCWGRAGCRRPRRCHRGGAPPAATSPPAP